MTLDDYSYLWNKEKDIWVLVDTAYGYAIINKKDQTSLVISDEELEASVIQQMLKSGNQVFPDINKAYESV